VRTWGATSGPAAQEKPDPDKPEPKTFLAEHAEEEFDAFEENMI
jgi:hypothetical protein